MHAPYICFTKPIPSPLSLPFPLPLRGRARILFRLPPRRQTVTRFLRQTMQGEAMINRLVGSALI